MISNQHDFRYFKSTCCSIISFDLIRKVVCEEISKIDFQDGRCCGFRIGTILSIFDLEVILLLQLSFNSNRRNQKWFSRWRLWQPLRSSNRHDTSGFHLHVNLLLHRKFHFIRLVLCEKMSKTDFQDDSCGGHLEFATETILAAFDPQVILLLQSKFRLKSTKGFKRDVENLFSRRRLCRPSWIFDRLSFRYFDSIRRPDAPHQLNAIIVFRGDVQDMHSQHFYHINV